jgi:lipopolysaccharide/colanic/teichoic acid biosynthesis glycosyltransferase
MALLIFIDSRGGVFFVQPRVGRNNRDFNVVKFRTMGMNAHSKGLITVGNRDRRITRVGYYLRRYKLDELPQLLNVLAGQMSIVGPRPEVRKYVETYNPSQMKVLEIRPGLTSYASLEFVSVNEIIARSKNPEKTYREEVLPKKLELNLKYREEMSLGIDIAIILKTLRLLLKNL